MKARDEGKGGEQAIAKPPMNYDPKPMRPPGHGYSRYSQEVYKGKAGGWSQSTSGWG